MVMTNIKATFACDIKTVWKIITSLEDYAWRSDISKIEIVKPINNLLNIQRIFIQRYLQLQYLNLINVMNLKWKIVV